MWLGIVLCGQRCLICLENLGFFIACFLQALFHVFLCGFYGRSGLGISRATVNFYGTSQVGDIVMDPEWWVFDRRWGEWRTHKGAPFPVSSARQRRWKAVFWNEAIGIAGLSSEPIDTPIGC